MSHVSGCRTANVDTAPAWGGCGVAGTNLEPNPASKMSRTRFVVCLTAKLAAIDRSGQDGTPRRDRHEPEQGRRPA